MENAVDALKIAFGVLVFVIAITVSFMLFSQAKSTSDIVLYSSDKTNYYTYEDETALPIVGIDTVISELNRCYRGDLIIIELYERDGTTPLVVDGITNSKFDTSNSDKIHKYIEDHLLGRNDTFEETFKEGQYINTITYILQ